MRKKETSHIEICGVIACGKTTVTSLANQLGFAPVLEKFDINPFLQQFYEKPEDHALETEIAFLIQHYNQVKTAKKGEKSFICDFSLVLDLAFADVTLSEKEKKVFMAVYNEISTQISFPNVIIHLECSPEVLLKRIKERGREVEKKIALDYLTKIDTALKSRIDETKNKVKIIEINSEKYNFVDNQEDKDFIINKLQDSLYNI